MVRVAGAVLTGGTSSRMGSNKALVVERGLPLARHVVDALLAGGCDPVVLVGGDARQLEPLGCEVVDDVHPGAGPLGGVIAAIGATDAGSVVVAACDLPALEGATVRRLIDAGEDADVAIAWTTRRHPLLLIDVPAGPALRQQFDAGERSLLAAVDGLARHGVRVVDVEVDEAQMRNVNTPGDVHE